MEEACNLSKENNQNAYRIISYKSIKMLDLGANDLKDTSRQDQEADELTQLKILGCKPIFKAGAGYFSNSQSWTQIWNNAAPSHTQRALSRSKVCPTFTILSLQEDNSLNHTLG